MLLPGRHAAPSIQIAPQDLSSCLDVDLTLKLDARDVQIPYGADVKTFYDGMAWCCICHVLWRDQVRENKLGQGSFGKVLHYKIQNTSEDVAVKFIKRKEGLKELKMLKKINAFDPDKNCFLKMLDHFEYKSLICVVFEKLDQTLSDIFLKRNQRPFDVCELRPVAQQLLVALRALKTIGLVHCDIKLNNVMFVNHQSYPYKVKLIDFGLAREKTSLRRLSNIQIVGYKAPEVVFDCPLDEAVDMWSVGCVLAGMYKAKHFYPRTCLYDYIASIIHMQGQPPDNVLLKDINEDQSDMLCVDQKTRITPEEALNHNFFTMKHLSEGTKDPYVTSTSRTTTPRTDCFMYKNG
uniref:Protein kinase domain-containing protein n=1 Tax=Oryzias latipes TaxID=8090 RepID=A0A3P9HV37_ORYLA